MKKAFISTASILLVITGTLITTPAANATIPNENIEQASLGDSITRGSAIGGRNSSGGGIHNPAANWSTGTDTRVPSHLRQLSQLKSTVVKGYNYSVGGTQSNDIPRQASQVNSNVDYTTILTGGNDICGASTINALPSKETYKDNVKQGVVTLLSKNSEMVVGLASVPNMKTLYSVGKTSIVSNLYHSSNRICPIALGTFNNETTTQAEARRNAVDARVREYNDALEEIANEYPTVVYDNDALYNTPFVLADISTADYFHPSYSGHTKIAERTWEAFKSQGAFNDPKPVVKPTVSLVSASTVSGSIKLAVVATSDTPIQKVFVFVPSLKTTIPLSLNGDGKYRTASINTTAYPNGTYTATFTAVDADGDSTSVDYKITIKN